MLDRKLIIKLVRFQEQEITEKRSEQKIVNNIKGTNCSQLYVKLIKFDKHPSFHHSNNVTQQNCNDKITKSDATYDHNEFKEFCVEFNSLHESGLSVVGQNKNNKTKHHVKHEPVEERTVEIKEETSSDEEDACNKTKHHVKHELVEERTVKIKEENLDDEEDAWSYSSDEFIKCEEIHIKPEKEDKNECLSDAVPSVSALQCCPHCDKRYKSKWKLTEHVKIHEPNVEWLHCDICTYKTHRKAALKLHGPVHDSIAERKLFECLKCNKKLKSKQSLRSHKRMHIDDAKITWYKCDICFKILKHKSGLAMHRKICSSPNKELLTCHTCGFKTLYKTSLTVHVQQHKNPSETPSFKCMTCKNKYTRKSYLLKHLKLIHGKPGEAEVYKCQKCTFETLYKENMSAHYKTHVSANEIYMYKCGKCSYQSKVRKTLISHTKTHMAREVAKPLKCPEKNCLFRANFNCILEVHLKSHKKNNSNLLWKFCNYCSYRSRNLRKVEKHKKTHKENLKIKVK